MRSSTITCAVVVTSREIRCAFCSSLSKSRLSRFGRRLGQIPSLLSILPPDTMSSQNSYLCDTLPQAKLAQASASHPPPSSRDSVYTSAAFQSEKSLTSDSLGMDPSEDVHPTPTPLQRKLCPRHKRMADEGTNLKLQQVCDCQIANVCLVLTFISSRLWMLSLCRSGRLSIQSGQTSRHHPIPAVP